MDRSMVKKSQGKLNPNTGGESLSMGAPWSAAEASLERGASLGEAVRANTGAALTAYAEGALGATKTRPPARNKTV